MAGVGRSIAKEAGAGAGAGVDTRNRGGFRVVAAGVVALRLEAGVGVGIIDPTAVGARGIK